MWNNKMRQIFVSIHQLSFNVEQSFTVRDYTAVYLDIYGMKKNYASISPRVGIGYNAFYRIWEYKYV